MVSWARRVVLVCLVALAGCSGFGGGSGSGVGGDGGGESTTSVTPAPVPTTADTAPHAPGLDADGVTNASALGAAHDAALRNTSFTRRVAWTFRYPNGSFYQGRWRVTRVGASRERYHDVLHRSGAWLGEFRRQGYVTTGVERWSGGDGTVRADVLFDGTRRYSALPARKAADVRRSATDPGGEQVARLLRGTETRVTGRALREGSTYHRVGALDPSRNRIPTDPGLAPPEDVSLSALVGERGLVRSYTVTYTTRTPAGTPLTVAYVVQYGQIEETAVERPAWYDAAIAATNGSNATESGGTDEPATGETGGTNGAVGNGTAATDPTANGTGDTGASTEAATTGGE